MERYFNMSVIHCLGFYLAHLTSFGFVMLVCFCCHLPPLVLKGDRCNPCNAQRAAEMALSRQTSMSLSLTVSIYICKIQTISAISNTKETLAQISLQSEAGEWKG